MKDKQKTIVKLRALPKISLPFACHYDDKTIITKNGELMQTIKISKGKWSIVGLIQSIRKSLATHLHDENLAVWIQTIKLTDSEEQIIQTNIEQNHKTTQNKFADDLSTEWAKKMNLIKQRIFLYLSPLLQRVCILSLQILIKISNHHC